MHKAKPDFCSWPTNRSPVMAPKLWCQNLDACGKPSTLVLITQCDLREVYYVNKSPNEVSDSVHTNATQAMRTRERDGEREVSYFCPRQDTTASWEEGGSELWTKEKKLLQSNYVVPVGNGIHLKAPGFSGKLNRDRPHAKSNRWLHFHCRRRSPQSPCGVQIASHAHRGFTGKSACVHSHVTFCRRIAQIEGSLSY